MNMQRRLFVSVILAVLLCSCFGTVALAGQSIAPATNLPAEISINRGAGRGDFLTVVLRLANGRDYPFVVDTGSPGTLLPKSAEPHLGKRVGKQKIHTLDSASEWVQLYTAPSLYIGNTSLVTAHTIGTWNDPLGVLGMDCLAHYCIQIDFEAGKLRFLDPERVDTSDLGQCFGLTSLRYAYIHHPPLFAKKSTDLLLDTGLPIDGMVSAPEFKRVAREQNAYPIPTIKDGVPVGLTSSMLCFPKCAWGDNSYYNLVLEPGRPDILGLRFLARHLVTFNFPKQVVYFKARSANPLPL
jgi:hypothetical protein